MFEMSDLLRMKVSELKGQLSKLGLNTKGNKIQLVQRLAEFLSIDCNVGAAPVEGVLFDYMLRCFDEKYFVTVIW